MQHFAKPGTSNEPHVMYTVYTIHYVKGKWGKLVLPGRPEVLAIESMPHVHMRCYLMHSCCIEEVANCTALN